MAFAVKHPDVMRILATAVFKAHPELDPDTTEFVLEMERVGKPFRRGHAEALLIVYPNGKRPKRKEHWWDKLMAGLRTPRTAL